MGLEWASKYCNFRFLVKADDDVFVDPHTDKSLKKARYTKDESLHWAVPSQRTSSSRGREVRGVLGRIQQN